MLCKKIVFPNSRVYMDSFEIPLPDGTLINAENQNKCSTTATMLFLGSIFDSEFRNIKFVCENY